MPDCVALQTRLRFFAEPTQLTYNPAMALVVFLRGVNVGGHRTFRPSALAKELRHFGVVNVGAAGTFIVRKPQSEAKFRVALQRKLPFETDIVICDSGDLLALEAGDSFGNAPLAPEIVRFVSILSKECRIQPALPISLPAGGEWLLRIVSAKGRFVFGMYRRHMKTIGYLGQIDKIVGAPVTTRNWNTIAAIIRVLRNEQRPSLEKKNRATRGSKLLARKVSAKIRP